MLGPPQRDEVVAALIRERPGRIPGCPRLRAVREILAPTLSGAERNRRRHRYRIHAAALAKPVGQLLVEVARLGFVVPLDVRVKGEEESVIHAAPWIDAPCRLKSPNTVSRNHQQD